MSVKNEIYTTIISLVLYGVLVIAVVVAAMHDKKQNNLIDEKDNYIYELNEKLIIKNIEVENYKDSVVLYNDSVNSLINEVDSISEELDSISEELQINKIKIERIREYNRIAAQGNNIKFLRGWINRVIN